MNNEREFDVVIYGATGFTGKLVAEYFHAQYKDNKQVKWAIAGRNAEKLDDIKASLGISENVSTIVADGGDADALDALTKRTQVVLTTVGPYQLYGEPLLKACIDNGTGYTDLCGEPAWMHQMIGKYQTKAKETGANIVFSCGFDSVPFDLGVFYLQQHAHAKTGQPIDYVKGRADLNHLPVVIHGHSLGSMIAGYLASQRNVDALVLEGSVTNVEQMTAARIPWFAKPFVSVEFSEEIKQVDNLKALQVYQAPLLIITGEKDTQTPPELAKSLYQHAKSQQKQIYIAKGKHHSNALTGKLLATHYEQLLKQITLSKSS